jgi:HlyD family secretion protein
MLLYRPDWLWITATMADTGIKASNVAGGAGALRIRQVSLSEERMMVRRGHQLHAHELSGGGTDMAPIKDDQSTSVASNVGHQRPATPSIIVGFVAVVVVALSLFYLLRPEPLLVQGEADATRLDIAARVDGRVREIPVERGQNVPANAVLVKLDNPETVAKLEQMKAATAVAEAQFANVLVGTRAETVAARKAQLERAQAALVLAQKTFDRTHTLTEQGNAPQARLDQMTDSLHESERAVDQAQSAYDQAVNGYTKEEQNISKANVEKANADIQSVQSIIDQLVVYAPIASQVYQRNVEPGEYVSPGVPLITLIDLADVWIHFDLREDLVKGLKVGDRFDVRIPALRDRSVPVEVRLIATKGEYASWRATRASGDFDLRTFSIRAYPVQPVPELRPGMSAYLDWRSRQ